MSRILRVVVGMAVLAAAAMAEESQPSAPPPAFAGLGLGDFEGEASIAAALRRAGGGMATEESPEPGLEFRGLWVQGPSRGDMLSPIAAEVRSRIDRFDIAAGVVAAPDGIAAGPSQWIGRIGLAQERPEGSERIELRTTLGSREAGGLLGLEIGPRLERRLRRGASFFIDGKAEAQAARDLEGGSWLMPGLAGEGMVGVAARAGLVR
jgi:hypothetical protein